MLRSGLLFAIALLSLAALLIPHEILWDAESHDAVTKLVALQVLCLLASFPLILSSQVSYNEKLSASAGLESLVSWGATVLQITLVASSVIHFQVWRENLVALEEYEDADISSENGVVFIDGVLGKDSYKEAVKKIEMSLPTTLMIRSSGGLIDSALNIATIVKEKALPVHVRDYCESACVIIASASPRLTANRDAVFGFHRGASLVRAQDSWSRFVSDQATDQIISVLRENGIPEDILSIAVETPPQQMYHVSAVDLTERGIIVQLTE